MTSLILNMRTYKKYKKMHTGRNFSKKKLSQVEKFVRINFPNAAKVIKPPNAAKVIWALYKQAHDQEFFWAREVSWNRDSLISFMLQ